MKILDSSYILHCDLDFSSGEYIAPNSILEEIKDKTANLALNIAVRKGSVKIRDPKKESIKIVQKKAHETGDLEYMSNADIDILALAFETKFLILTDDYRLQNVASSIGLKWEAYFQRGIKSKLKWEKICEGCGRKYEKGEKCEICGSTLRKISKPL